MKSISQQLTILLIIFTHSLFAQTEALDSINNAKDLIDCIQDFNIRYHRIKVSKSKNLDSIYLLNQRHFKNANIPVEFFRNNFDHQKYNSFLIKEEKKKLVKYFIEENNQASLKFTASLEYFKLIGDTRDEKFTNRKLEELHNYSRINALNFYFQHYVERKRYQKEIGQNNSVYIKELEDSQVVLNKFISHFTNEQFTYYGNTDVNKQLFLGAKVHHDNDVFLPTINEDRNYTGGGLFEVYTDLLKMRFFFNMFPNLFSETLSYQSIFGGVYAFTPQIRYKGLTLNEKLEKYQLDRPFGSFEFFGRAKYRMQQAGKWRSRSALSIGQIGGKKGSVVQSIIHRDQFVSSPKVEGWETQISAGGRFAFNYDLKWDFNLLAPSEKNNLWNPAATASIHIGNYLTAFDLGLQFSNLKFTQKSGHGVPKLYARNLKIHYELEFFTRYVQHNTMLEDFGLWKTFEEDPEENRPISAFVLNEEEINRFILYGSFHFGIKLRKTTVFYNVVVHTKEFETELNKNEKYYGWGSFGISFDM